MYRTSGQRTNPFGKHSHDDNLDPTRLNQAITVSDEGTGLGLAMADRFCRRSGGACRNDSTPAVVATVTLISALSKSVRENNLVFSDLLMPGKADGNDLTNWVSDNRPGKPVLLTSAIGGEHENQNKFEVLRKPATSNSLARQPRESFTEPRQGINYSRSHVSGIVD